MTHDKYKLVDLFAGLGGIRRGFEMTGRFKNVLSAEVDKYACAAYKHLYGEDPFNDVTTDEFKQKVSDTEYDILLAGFPCQAFSIAGKQKGFEDETRGTLFFDIAKILDGTKPKAFLLENVAGLINHDKGKTFQIIAKTLDTLGYKVVGVEVHNTLMGKVYSTKSENIVRTPYNFGIPQRRERVYLLGFRKSDIPHAYEFPELPQGRDLGLYTDLHDVLEQDVAPEYYLSQQYINTLNNHKNRNKAKNFGFGYIVVNDDKHPIANTIMATGGSGKERNLIRQYKKEYDGLRVKGKKTPLNKEGLRYMTPTEWGKLQGFVNYAFMKNGVDTFSFPRNISRTQRYKLLGNSVCIPIIESLAEYMHERLQEIYGTK